MVQPIELIDRICKELEDNYNLIVMWNRYDKNDENIEIKIWNNDNQDLLRHFIDTELHTLNKLNGILWGIKATLSGDIHNE